MQLFYRISSFVMVLLLLLGCSKKKTESELWSAAELFEKEENYQSALNDYEQIVKDYPHGEKSEEALQKTAFLYYNNLNDFKKAIELHEKLIKDYPKSKYVPQARFMIGFIYANDLKDSDMARRYYNEFLEKYPDNELVASVKWELEHLGEDVNEQLKDLFSEGKTQGTANKKK